MEPPVDHYLLAYGRSFRARLMRFFGLSLLLHGALLLRVAWVSERPLPTIGMNPIQVDVWGLGDGNAKSSRGKIPQKNSRQYLKSPLNVLKESKKKEGTDSGKTGGSIAKSNDGATLIADGKPHYPQRSRALGEQGEVVIQIVITEEGTLQDIVLKKSSGYLRLDQSAMAFLKTARFSLAGILKEPLVKEFSIVYRLDDE